MKLRVGAIVSRVNDLLVITSFPATSDIVAEITLFCSKLPEKVRAALQLDPSQVVLALESAPVMTILAPATLHEPLIGKCEELLILM